MPHFPTRLLGLGGSAGFSGAVCGQASNTLTATGANQGAALALTTEINNVTTVAASTGVRLPPGEMGAFVVVRNGGANALLVYPATGGAINALATNAGYSVAAGSTALLFGVTDTLWVALAAA